MSSARRKHLVIPDTQVRPGVSTDHLEWAGRYALEKQPDVIVHLGDHWDFPSISRWLSPGRKAELEMAYGEDVAAGNEALDRFHQPIRAWNRKRPSRRRYRPELHYCLGNHDVRILSVLEEHPHLRGALSLADLAAARLGWTVHDFLQPVVLDGIAYCHFFPRGANGRVVQSRRGATNARLMVQREGRSCTAGHQQGLDVHIQETGAGRRRGVIAGSYYCHAEEYLTPQGNNHWHGLLLKHEVAAGDYALCEVPLDYLRRCYA